MSRVYDAGYLIGIHFDPMIWHEGWEEGYIDLVDRIFDVITPDRIAWISMGSLRFNPEQKRKMENNFPGSSMLNLKWLKAMIIKFVTLSPYD